MEEARLLDQGGTACPTCGVAEAEESSPGGGGKAAGPGWHHTPRAWSSQGRRSHHPLEEARLRDQGGATPHVWIHRICHPRHWTRPRACL